ncbi:hypothetical protein K504DRAFT_459765 [Pleomassaria siparia CBS 279.74]|uniref:Secreted protein n=1 Tax=Pleomassaria siparia CBS 279.74 TaxID=1314801 RepID=A0A6G1K1S3_9PLEO|nr:hypothetical protein K504DRAFT_459765 [Pleomassaria siparia CBS 279.74]
MYVCSRGCALVCVVVVALAFSVFQEGTHTLNTALTPLVPSRLVSSPLPSPPLLSSPLVSSPLLFWADPLSSPPL